MVALLFSAEDTASMIYKKNLTFGFVEDHTATEAFKNRSFFSLEYSDFTLTVCF